MCFLEGYIKEQWSKEELLNNETTNIMKYEVLYENVTKLTFLVLIVSLIIIPKTTNKYFITKNV